MSEKNALLCTRGKRKTAWQGAHCRYDYVIPAFLTNFSGSFSKLFPLTRIELQLSV